MTPLMLAALFLPLVVLATLRLTRLITTDWLGEWLIVAPAKHWAVETANDEQVITSDLEEGASEIWNDLDWTQVTSWRLKLVKGLDCPFCVGYWIGLVILGVTAAVIFAPVWLVIAWGILLGSLALNYIVGHVSSKID